MTTDKTPTPPSPEVFEQTLTDIDKRIHKQYRRNIIIAHVFNVLGGGFAGAGIAFLITGGDAGNLITVVLAALIVVIGAFIKKSAERRFTAEHLRLDAAQRIYDLGVAIRDAQATAEARKMREDGE